MNEEDLLPSEVKRRDRNDKRRLREQKKRRNERIKLRRGRLPVRFRSFEIDVEIGTGCWHVSEVDRIRARKLLIESCNSTANLNDRCSKNSGCLHPLHLVKSKK